MEFIIKPDDDSFNVMLETNQYKKLWDTYGQRVVEAFRQRSKLEFQQKLITAHVFDGQQSTGGKPHRPMLLAGDNRPEPFKLATLVHELTHRLLGGNALAPVSLGLADEGVAQDDITIEFDHRHVYLISYDVTRSLGEDWGEIYKRYEERPAEYADDPHQRAWKWAMNFSYEERQRMLTFLVSKRVERKDWDEWNSKPIQRIGFATWNQWLLDAAAGN